MLSSRSYVPGVLAFLFILITSWVLAEEKRNTAVLDLRPMEGVSEPMAQLMSEVLRAELYTTGQFNIMNREDMKVIFQEIAFQQSGACDTTCVVEVGQALGVEYMIIGSIGKVDQTYILTAKLVDIAKMSNIRMVNEWHTGPAGELQQTISYVAQSLSGQVPKLPDRVEAGERTKTKEQLSRHPTIELEFTPNPFFRVGRSAMGIKSGKIYRDADAQMPLALPHTLQMPILAPYYFSNNIKYEFALDRSKDVGASLWIDSIWSWYEKDVKRILGSKLWYQEIGRQKAYPIVLVSAITKLKLSPNTTRKEIRQFMKTVPYWRVTRESPRKIIYEIHRGKSPSIIFRWDHGRFYRIDLGKWMFDAADAKTKIKTKGHISEWDPRRRLSLGYRAGYGSALNRSVLFGLAADLRLSYRVSLISEGWIGFGEGTFKGDGVFGLRWRLFEGRRTPELAIGLIARRQKNSYQVIFPSGGRQEVIEWKQFTGRFVGLGYTHAVAKRVNFMIQGRAIVWSGPDLFLPTVKDMSTGVSEGRSHQLLSAQVLVGFNFQLGPGS